MLREIAMAPVPAKEEMAAGIRAEREKLSGYQMKIKEAKLPVIVMFEGWGAAGKGSILGRVIKDLDPRFCSVATMDQEPSAEDRRYPFLHRYLVEIPEEGKIKFFDTCWMEAIRN